MRLQTGNCLEVGAQGVFPLNRSDFSTVLARLEVDNISELSHSATEPFSVETQLHNHVYNTQNVTQSSKDRLQGIWPPNAIHGFVLLPMI